MGLAGSSWTRRVGGGVARRHRATLAVVVGCLLLGAFSAPVGAEVAQPAAGPVLEASLVRTTNPAVVDEPVVFVATVTITGDQAATGVDFVHSVDPLFANMSGSPSKGLCGEVGSTYDMTCSIGSLGAGESVTVTLEAIPASTGNAYLTSVAYASNASAASSGTLWTTIVEGAGDECDAWASSSGDDGAPGTYEQPRRTLRSLVALLDPGETGCVKGGETLDLSGGWGVVNQGGGQPGSPVTVRTEPGAPRAGMQGLIHIQAHIHDLVIEDLDLAGPTSGPVKNNLLLVEGDRITISGNEITYPRGICMQLGNVNTDGRADDVLVERNRIHDCGTSPDLEWTTADSGAHGIYVQHAQDAVITDNYIYDNRFRGVQTWPGPKGTVIKNNVLDGNGSNVNIGHDLPSHVSEDTLVTDNVITHATLFFDLSKNPANVHGTIPTNEYGNVVSGNCVYHQDPTRNFSGTGYSQTGNLIVDPQYVDRAAKDFTLQPGSPCAGKGPQTSVDPEPGAVPGAPTGVTAAPGERQATVSWNPPDDTGDGPLTGYRVTRSPGGQTTEVAPSTTSVVIGSLTPGTAYTFTVRAVNEHGVGPASDPSTPVTPVGFSDVGPSHPFHDEIIWLALSGITTGFGDGTFRPTDVVDRQSMAAFLHRNAGAPPFTPPASSTFSDVPTSHTFFSEIHWLASTGITEGYPDGTYRPREHVTRDSMAAFLYRAAGSPAYTPPATSKFPDVPTNHTFFTEIHWLASTGITQGDTDGAYRPADPVTRQAMAAFLQRFNTKL